MTARQGSHDELPTPPPYEPSRAVMGGLLQGGGRCRAELRGPGLVFGFYF